MSTPYIVSADIYLLVKEWAKQNGFILPPEKFFYQLRKEFSDQMRRMFPNFELVAEQEIFHGLTKLVMESGLPSISLDRVYYYSGLKLEIARLVDEAGKDRGLLGHRADSPLLLQQIRRLQKSELREVVLVDDVLYSGKLLERIINILSSINIRVPLICVGIGIAEGIKYLDSKKCTIHCVRTYEEVIDEVCERDFYPGVPLSGRLLVGNNNIGVPYILPFGNPQSWASIPSEHALTFSKFCLRQTIKLFEEVGRCSSKPVLCRDIGRKVIGLPMDGTRYIDALLKIL